MAFIPYLVLSDYYSIIDAGQMNGLSAYGVERKQAEAFAIDEIKGYLSAKFDLDFEFTPTLPYDIAKTYHAGDRITLNYDAWVSGKTYVADDFMCLSGGCYKCQIDNSDTVFDLSKWLYVGKQYDIYHIPFPYPAFQLNIGQQDGVTIPGYYKVGDIVCWANHTYTALMETNPVSHNQLLNYKQTKDAPPPNVFPTATNGDKFWQDNGEYVIDAGVLPNDQSWLLEDNRTAKIVELTTTIALYKLLRRVMGSNMPEQRGREYQQAKEYLKCVLGGDFNIEVPTKQPDQAKSFWWTSKPKKINGY
jgi:hypothetical protein